MGVASERAVSIPQITYDHIDDSEEKRDVSFCLVQEEQSGTVEGKAPVQNSVYIRLKLVSVIMFSLNRDS